MRSHGFAWPLHPYQVASFILFSGFVAGFHVFFLPALPEDWLRWFWVAIFNLATVFLIYFAGKATACDPRDPSCNPLGRKIYEHEDKEARERRRNMVFPGKEWCQYCLEHVHPHSKHCRACDKCVDIFDHHCKWLNNCVGRANYTPFFLSLVSAAFLLTLQAGIGLWIIIRTAIDERGPETQRILSEWSTLSLTKIRIVLSIYIAVLLLVDTGILQLMKFHMFLYYHNLTTYEWIVYQRRVSEARKHGHPDPPIPTGTEPIKLRIKRQARREKLEAQQKALADADSKSNNSENQSTVANAGNPEDVKMCHCGPLMCGPCPNWCCFSCCESDSDGSMVPVHVTGGLTGSAGSSTVPTPFTVSVLSSRVTPAPAASVHSVFDLERQDILELAPIPPRLAPLPQSIPAQSPTKGSGMSPEAKSPHGSPVSETQSDKYDVNRYQSSGLFPAATPIKLHIPQNVTVATPVDHMPASPIRHLQNLSSLDENRSPVIPKTQPGRYDPAAASAAFSAAVNVTRGITGKPQPSSDDASSEYSVSRIHSIQSSDYSMNPTSPVPHDENGPIDARIVLPPINQGSAPHKPQIAGAPRASAPSIHVPVRIHQMNSPNGPTSSGSTRF